METKNTQSQVENGIKKKNQKKSMRRQKETFMPRARDHSHKAFGITSPDASLPMPTLQFMAYWSQRRIEPNAVIILLKSPT